jgi:predicted ester cyclase
MNDLDANKAASRRLYEEVFGRGNLDAADEIMAPDIVNHGPGSPPLVGTDQIRRQAQRLRGAFLDFTAILHDQVAEGDRVCSRWTGRGTHTKDMELPTGVVPASGRTIAFDEIRIDRYSDGRIVESWFIPDRFSLWQALGLIASPQSTSSLARGAD